MYSVVLMAALTTGMDAPDFGRRGCHGCHGCSGCYSCGGCWGGRGCCGGCYGCGGGCWGGGSSCGGGYGCGGGCWGGGSSCGGGYGCGCGGYASWGGGRVAGTGGAYYAYSPYGTPVTYTAQAQGTAAAAPASSGVMPATFVVNLPADAKLTVDGTPMRTTSARRVFATPPLQAGKTYSYTLRAEITRGGETFSATREMAVRPGQRTEVTLDIPTLTTTASR